MPPPPWAPPTCEQIGLIGVNWSRGWIIEDNEIRNSACAGITLGKYHTDRDKELSDTPGFKTLIDMARTHTIPWSRERIGQHLVRNNLIETCGQAGICGSLGGAFSTISGNVIRDIWVRRRFGGYEMGGIKLHGGVDVVITGNHIYRAHLGVWLDWMGQGARISRNLFHDNWRDLFLEGNHGPILVDNNIMLSTWWLNSQGTALAHNLMAGGMIKQGEDSRHLPLLSPHSTAWQSDENFPHGDDRFFNNVFAGPNHRLCDLPRCRMPDVFAGNVYLGDAKPRDDEPSPVVLSADPKIQLESRADGFYLRMTCDPGWIAAQRAKLVTTQTLGAATLPKQSYSNPDGTSLRIDTDYFGKARDLDHPTPGPFESPGTGVIELKVAEAKPCDLKSSKHPTR